MTHRSAGLMLGFMLVGSSAALVPTALTVVEYPLPRPKAFPHDPAVGRDAGRAAVRHRRRAPARRRDLDGAVRDEPDRPGRPGERHLRIFPLPAPGSRPRRLIVDAQGIVWYSDYARDRLGRLDPATGQ